MLIKIVCTNLRKTSAWPQTSKCDKGKLWAGQGSYEGTRPTTDQGDRSGGWCRKSSEKDAYIICVNTEIIERMLNKNWMCQWGQLSGWWVTMVWVITPTASAFTTVRLKPTVIQHCSNCEQQNWHEQNHWKKTLEWKKYLQFLLCWGDSYICIPDCGCGDTACRWGHMSTNINMVSTPELCTGSTGWNLGYQCTMFCSNPDNDIFFFFRK